MQIGRRSRRVIGGLWIAAGVVWVTIGGGCCSTILTEKLPRVEPATIDDASLSAADLLTLDCTLTNGRRERYEANLRAPLSNYAHERGVPTGPLPPSARPLQLPDGRRIGPTGGAADPAPLALAIDRWGNFDLRSEGTTELLCCFSGSSPVDWTAPETWALCLLYPPAVAIDVVTAPIQCVLLLAFFPKC